MKTSKVNQVMAAAAVIFGLGGGAAMADGVELQAFAIDSNGNVVMASAESRQVLRVEQGGRVTVLAGSGEAGNDGDGGYATDGRFQSPKGVAIEQDGSILFGDSGTGQVWRVDSLSGVLTAVAGMATPPMDEPYIKIKTPNTPESWYVGTLKTIRWTHNLGKSVRFTVAVKRGGGESAWETIASDVQAKEINWRVTGPTTSKARFRVTQQATAGGKSKGSKPALQSDVNDADVTLVAGN